MMSRNGASLVGMLRSCCGECANDALWLPREMRAKEARSALTCAVARWDSPHLASGVERASAVGDIHRDFKADAQFGIRRCRPLHDCLLGWNE